MDLIFVLGTGRCRLTFFKNLFAGSDNFNSYNTNKINWYRDEKTLRVIDSLIKKIKDVGDDKKHVLIGSNLLPHVDYIENGVGVESFKIVIHRDIDSYISSSISLFDGLNPFNGDGRDNNYLGSIANKFPDYKYDVNTPVVDYFRKYHTEYENRSLKLNNAKHILYDDTKSELIAIRRKEPFKDTDFTDLLSEIEFDRHFKNRQEVYLKRRKQILSKTIKKAFSPRNQNSNFSSDIYSGPKVRLMVLSYIRPSELHHFAQQVEQLERGFLSYDYNENVKFYFRAHLDISDFSIDWDKSRMGKEYFFAKFNYLKNKLNSYGGVDFSYGGDIKGCNDLRRQAVRKYGDKVNAFSYLDPDIVFPYKIIDHINKFLPYINKNYSLYVLSNQLFVRESAANIYFNKISNIVSNSKTINFNTIDSLNDDTVSIEKRQGIKASGLFSLMSAPFLRLTDIPDELQSYGNDDKYVTECISLFNNYAKNEHVLTFLLRNLNVYQLSGNERKTPEQPFISYKRSNERNKKIMHRKSENKLSELFDRFTEKIRNRNNDE